MQLEYSKAETKDNEKKWRPSNEPVEDQIRPTVVKQLLIRKKSYQHSVEHQNNLITDLIARNEQYRHEFRKKAEKRKQIIIQMESDSENLKGIEDKIQDVNRMLN